MNLPAASGEVSAFRQSNRSIVSVRFSKTRFPPLPEPGVKVRQAGKQLPLLPAVHPVQLRLVEDIHAEFLRLLELRPRLVAGEHVVGPFANAAGDFAADERDAI
jgi:hypothetical protein